MRKKKVAYFYDSKLIYKIRQNRPILLRRAAPNEAN